MEYLTDNSYSLDFIHDLSESSSFYELMTKIGLHGMFDIPMEKVVSAVVSFFIGLDSWYAYDESNDPGQKKLHGIAGLALGNSEDMIANAPDEFIPYMCTKHLVQMILCIMIGTDRDAYDFNRVRRAMIYAKFMNHHSPDLFRTCRTENGDNILMVIAIIRNFMKIKTAGDDLSTAWKGNAIMGSICARSILYENFDPVVAYITDRSDLYQFITFLLNDAKVDPRETNNSGQCFCDFITNFNIARAKLINHL